MKQNSNQAIGFVVCNPVAGKYLLKQGYSIIDLIPNKFNRNRTAFVFKKDSGINNDYNQIMIQIRKS